MTKPLGLEEFFSVDIKTGLINSLLHNYLDDWRTIIRLLKIRLKERDNLRTAEMYAYYQAKICICDERVLFYFQTEDLKKSRKYERARDSAIEMANRLF